MGLPFWEMPDHLVIDGTAYPIDTDFRTGIRVRQMIWDPYYQTHTAQLFDGIRRLLFGGTASVCCEENAFFAAVVWYLLDGRMSCERILRRMDGGDVTSRFTEAASRFTEAAGDVEPVFSYLWDMPALYAAFLEVYRVDLLSAKMHLWQFDALFAALPEHCSLRKTMALRASSAEDAEDGDARAFLAAQKLSVRIPPTETLHAFCLCAAQYGVITDGVDDDVTEDVDSDLTPRSFANLDETKTAGDCCQLKR